MEITMESRKTTWISFIQTKAKMKVQWDCDVHYDSYNIKSNTTRSVYMKYTFFDIKNDAPIPSSQLIVKKEGIPQAITKAVVSSRKDTFSSEKIDDPFIEVKDNLANIEKKKLKEKRLSKTMLERTWDEHITRSIKIENKNDRPVKLKLKIRDSPAEELTFLGSEPEPNVKQSPEYHYDLDIGAEKEVILQIILVLKRKETIKTPAVKPQYDRRNRPPMAQAAMDNFGFEDNYVEDEQAAEEAEMPQVLDDVFVQQANQCPPNARMGR